MLERNSVPARVECWRDGVKRARSRSYKAECGWPKFRLKTALIAARVCATRALHLSACALPALLSYSLHEQLRQGDTNTRCSCSADRR
jgi:hypothetical protein